MVRNRLKTFDYDNALLFLNKITIYVLLGWLDEGNNEFGEKVFVDIFSTFRHF